MKSIDFSALLSFLYHRFAEQISSNGESERRAKFGDQYGCSAGFSDYVVGFRTIYRVFLFRTDASCVAALHLFSALA